MLAAAATLFVMMFVLDATLYSLMLIAEQIVDGLHWVECVQRNLYEYSIPVAHRTIPETRQLQGLQSLPFLLLLEMKPVDGSTNLGRSKALPGNPW